MISAILTTYLPFQNLKGYIPEPEDRYASYRDGQLYNFIDVDFHGFTFDPVQMEDHDFFGGPVVSCEYFELLLEY